MAPEQLSKGPITARTDLFSLAVVLYRALTGVLPFTGDSFAAVAHAILHEKPVPPERLDPKIPGALSNLVLRCLEKSPEDRAGSAPEVLRAIDAVESGKSLNSPMPRKRRSRALGLTLALLLAALAGLRIRGSQPSAAPSAIAPPSPPAATATEPPPPSSEAPEATAVATTPQAPIEKPRPAPPEESSTKETVAAEPAASREEAIPESATEAELFYDARVSFERGELEESRATLETLLSRNPTFEGARELHVEIADRIWETSLPLRLSASHKHRLGGCEGELSLASLGVRFESEDHDWAFRPEDIRVMERPERTTFIVETFEKGTLSLGKNKRYRFELATPIEDADWTRYQRLLK
jgi:hypothetical protein